MLNSNFSLDDYILEQFENSDFHGIKNKALLCGVPSKVGGTGLHEGINHYLVSLTTLRYNGRTSETWVVLPVCKDSKEIIDKKIPIFIEGKLHSSYSFNGESALHQFIVPKKVYRLSELPNLPQHKEFYLNYTLNNRVILEGKIISEPNYTFVQDLNNGVTNFKLQYEDSTGKFKRVNCSLWDNMNDITTLKVEDDIRVVSRFSALEDWKNSDIQIVGNFYTTFRKNKPATYSLLVQRIEKVGDSVVSSLERMFM